MFIRDRIKNKNVNYCVVSFFFVPLWPRIQNEEEYGTEREQELEVVLLHQGGGRDAQRLGESAALLRKGDPDAEAEDDRQQCPTVHGEGH